MNAAGEEAAVLARRHEALSELAGWLAGENMAPPALDILGEGPLGEHLIRLVARIRDGLTDPRWPLGWLPRVNPSSVDAGLLLLHQARQASKAAPALESPVLEALALCRGGTDVGLSAEAQRLAELETLKASLLDSEREEDLHRLAEINRELRSLRGDRWSTLCRAMLQPLQGLFQGPVPENIAELGSSLKPEARWTAILEDLHSFAASVRDQVHLALREHIPALSEQITAWCSDLLTQTEVQRGQAAAQTQALDQVEYEIDQAQGQLQGAQAQLQELQERWHELWPEVCIDQPESAPPPITAEALQTRQDAFNAWKEQHAAEWERHRRWRSIMEEWVSRLGQPGEAQRSSLRDLYRRHANIVGVTCNEAGQRAFYDRSDFTPFDLVIVDEVSKATPPELLEAALLGRKLILVCDPRQLPPMFREQDASYEEAAADGELDLAEVDRYRTLLTSSLFQPLYEAAPQSLRHILVIQYRMQSQIMAVVNLFYGGLLRAGPDEETLDRLRQHHLRIRDRRGGWFLEPHHHVLWIDSTCDARGRPVFERQSGTSKVNMLEVELIAASLQRLNQALVERGYGSQHRITAGQAEHGLTLRSWVERVLTKPPGETVDDLFSHDRITLNGRNARPDEQVHAGDQLAIDARKRCGVISFYGAQIREIRHRISRIQAQDPQAFSALDLKTNTVDQFQGQECPIVLVSLVRARNQARFGGHVKQYQRINVAMSRAQELLVIVGSERTYRNVEIDLPGMDGGPPRKSLVYRKIYELVTGFGGRRYARQLLA